MNARLIIPESMKSEILKAIHEGHLGITKCRARAKESIWWPGLSTKIKRMISSCDSCSKQQVYYKEPMIKSEFPERPRQRVGVDLLKLKGEWYVIVADYYSRFSEVALLENQKALTVINHMKSIFSRHGIPETVKSDCRSHFSTSIEITREYKLFFKKYGFSTVTSSPKYSQSNEFF
ncbi:Uncharacterized protein K02A2.6 [Araneus ventricosus]|uniref:RNA-directed DNA polymerase n=1 Tax=Araneus ventricosus TaxID=182803 RepID=A0A4Y2EYJ9_ARAVE|nr:Uncharacterized protein K02A2.6 [Araneus ventricosus]